MKPMTTKQATEAHIDSCIDCQTGRYFWDGCMESSTCSVKCQHCGGRVWFQGNLQDQESNFTCPYCGIAQTNKHLGTNS